MSDNKWGQGGFAEGPKEREPGAAPLKVEQSVSGSTCTKHPDKNASWECEKCGGICCDECAGSYHSCPSCGGVCIPRKQIVSAKTQTASFFMLLLDSFTYPLRGKGIILIIIGVVFFFMLSFMMALPYIRWIFLFLGGGFFIAFFMSIIETSADGKKELPDWPDVTNFIDDLAMPFFKFIGTFLISYGPLIIYLLYCRRNPFNASKTIINALDILGGIYFPMALIATALGLPYVFNPITIVVSIGRVFLHYAVALLLIAFLVFMRGTGVEFLVKNLGLFGIFLSGVFLFYTLTIQMRILGIIYYVNQEKLGWFSRR